MKVSHDGLLLTDKQITVRIDPATLKSGLILPKIMYQIVATVEQEEVYNGMTIPIPHVLFYFLHHKELQVVGVIIEQTILTGSCKLTIKDFAYRLSVNPVTVCNALYNLRKMNLLIEIADGKRGAGKVRKINFEAIQHLNNLVEGEDFNLLSRVRRKLGNKKNVTKINLADLEKVYNHKILPPEHDPEEEEEYD